MHLFKTEEDLDTYLTKYFNNGFVGVTIHNNPYLCNKTHQMQIIKLQSYIQKLSGQKYMLHFSPNGEVNLMVRLFSGMIFEYKELLVGTDQKYIHKTHSDIFLEKSADNINKIVEENKQLKAEIDTLRIQMQEVYYAPCMPGFIKFQKSFEKILQTSK